MRLTPDLTDAAVLQELGVRLARQRIDAGFTQANLATQAGVSKRTLERVEAGHGAELVTLIRLLRVLGLIDGVESLVPDPPPSPIALLKRQGKRRLRVSQPRGQQGSGSGASRAPFRKPWKWGQ
ncbi:MAG: helix-turn-helix domain-containing protein [Steroidobacteraceae bacterium]